MGTPVPENPLDLDPTKWYKVTVENWYYIPLAPVDCTIIDGRTPSACILGANIITWIAGNFQCTDTQLIPDYPRIVQKILSISDPYDTEAACLLEL